MTTGRRISELMTMGGRTALVTGGAGFIGRAAGEVLAEAGANVVLADMDGAAAKETAEALAATFGVSASGVAIDLADEAAVRDLPVRVHADYGGLDVIVHAAAFVGTSDLEGWVVPFEEQTADTWRAAMDVNLTSLFVLVQAALPYLKEKGMGSVIGLSSIYGVDGPDMRLYEGLDMGNPAAYAASKGGMIQLARWMATVLAPEVRVNTITPGGIYRNQPETFVKRYEDRTPLSRMGTEEDMKGALMYLASDLSRYVTGQNLIVDGGWTVW